jgi:streptomycin 3"-adenylyltransferase
MSQYGWADCPAPVRAQVMGFRDALADALGSNLAGLYLHGSLAMGCFNPACSDVDLLAVTRRGMTVETKRRVAELLLKTSGAPSPIEISFLREADLRPWEYPTPYDFHYSRDWHEKLQRELSSGEWQAWEDEHGRDEDLAAHITATLQRGICLYGESIAAAFPPIPPEHYRASLLADFEWGYERLGQNPVYFILNACRIYAYVREGRICSKDEGGVRAVAALPQEFREIVGRALDVYRGQQIAGQFERTELARFAAHMREQIKMPPSP